MNKWGYDFVPHPYEDGLEYFKYFWDARGAQPVAYDQGITILTPTAGDAFWVYGYVRRSQIPDDDRAEKHIYSMRRRSSVCFSRRVPDGEMGTVALEDLVPLTREQFEYAKAEGWPE